MDRQGIGPTELARLSGKTKQDISRWANGERQLQAPIAAELAHHLSCQPEELLYPGKPQSNPDAFRPTLIPGSELVGESNFPIYGAAAGGAAGHLIIDYNPIQYVRWPSILAGVRGAYGIRVDGESMVPAFRPGDFALVHPHALPESETDVILFDHDPKTGDAEALIKRLIGVTEKVWKLEQYNPAKKFTADRADWPICHRVVGRYDRRR